MQPELPYYGDYPTEAFSFDPIRDLRELITHYRRYVSLATYCMGNEGLLGRPLGSEIYKLIKQVDPDRLVLHQDGGIQHPRELRFPERSYHGLETGQFFLRCPVCRP